VYAGYFFFFSYRVVYYSPFCILQFFSLLFTYPSRPGRRGGATRATRREFVPAKKQKTKTVIEYNFPALHPPRFVLSM